jgi:hypothetical protein
MKQQLFDVQELPMAELQKIGLAQNGLISLKEDDLQALLAGRRTGMLRLENLTGDGMHIPMIDAKLSFKRNAQGNMDMLLHPIYKEATYPEYLTDVEAEKLQNGTAVNIEKVVTDKEGHRQDILIEYDPETREFIITDSEKILVPDMVNNEFLSLEQRERYKKGKEVQLADGTVFQYSGTDKKGMVSNKLALVASLIVDGGLSYILYKGLNALLNKKRDEKDAASFSRGYEQAVSDMNENKMVTEQSKAQKVDQQHYRRTGR